MTHFASVSAAGSDRTERVAVREHRDGWITEGAETTWGDGPVVVDGVPHDAVRQQNGLVVFRRAEDRRQHWIHSVPADLLVGVSVGGGLLLGGSVAAWGNANFLAPALGLITYCGIYGGVYAGRWFEVGSIEKDISSKLPSIRSDLDSYPRMIEFMRYVVRRLDRSATESDRHSQALKWIVWPVLAALAVWLVASFLVAASG
jgi:hypothetical protein